MQPNSPQTEIERIQKERWEAAKEDGPFFFIARNISVLLVCDMVFRAALASGHFPHWLGTQGQMSVSEIVSEILTGLATGAWEWSGLERKATARDPTKDRTMI